MNVSLLHRARGLAPWWDSGDEETLYTSGGRVLLPAGDGSWYYVGLTTFQEEVTLWIDQDPESSPGAQYATYISFDVGGSGYKFQLKVVQGQIVEDVGDPVSGTLIEALALQSDDLSFYDLYLDTFQNEIVWKVNQIANP